jgi:hypothetical protein
MIPTVLVGGALVGRWWFVPLAGLGWAALLLSGETIAWNGVPGAFTFAVINATVGLLLQRGVALLWHRASRPKPSARPG